MSDDTKPDTTPLFARLDRWGLLSVVVIAISSLLFFAFAPAERLDAGTDFLVLLLTGFGFVAAFRGPLFKASTSSTSTSSTAPTRIEVQPAGDDPRRVRREGSIDVVLEVGIAMLAIGFFVVAALFSSGCASTGGVAGALLAAKPILDTTCMVARRACDLVTRGCDLVSPEPVSSGHEDPWSGFPPARPGHVDDGAELEPSVDDVDASTDAPEPLDEPDPAAPIADTAEPLDPSVAVAQ